MTFISLILIPLKDGDGGGGVKSAVENFYTLLEYINIYSTEQNFVCENRSNMTILLTCEHDFKKRKKNHGPKSIKMKNYMIFDMLYNVHLPF